MSKQDTRLLELHFSQLTRVWNKSKHNNYSDNKKNSYQAKLSELFEKLFNEDFTVLTETQTIDRYQIIDFFFKSLEFLDSSTLNSIPFEIIKCLECVLNEWLDTIIDEHIIVTSLVNRMNDFSFDRTLEINSPKYDLLRNIYGIEFNRRLIQINLPRYLARDYLANVVIYHELGHFIDNFYQISNGIRDKVCNEYLTGKITGDDKTDIEKYFPFLTEMYSDDDKKTLFSWHIAEFFSDLFASQYIDRCSGYYLEYITQNNSQYSYSHPSTINRNELVENFLNMTPNSYTLTEIKKAVSKITGKELKIRYKIIDHVDILDLLPIEITQNAELHYLFVLGWDLWLNKWEKFKEHNNLGFELNQDKVYDIINNLIEKSIGNFIIKSNWTSNAST